MGNFASTKETLNSSFEEKRSIPFDSLSEGDNKSSNSNREYIVKPMSHRISIAGSVSDRDNKALRNQYFDKLTRINTSVRKESDERRKKSNGGNMNDVDCNISFDNESSFNNVSMGCMNNLNNLNNTFSEGNEFGSGNNTSHMNTVNNNRRKTVSSSSYGVLRRFLYNSEEIKGITLPILDCVNDDKNDKDDKINDKINDKDDKINDKDPIPINENNETTTNSKTLINSDTRSSHNKTNSASNINTTSNGFNFNSFNPQPHPHEYEINPNYMSKNRDSTTATATDKNTNLTNSSNSTNLINENSIDPNDTISEINNLYNSTLSRQQNEYELNFIKDGEDLRRSYIAKLIYKNVWRPSVKEKDHNTVIIFDWDDTLLCTSFLTPNGIFDEDMELTDKEKEKLAKLEFSSLRLLNAAILKGDTYIITNAAPGWVEYSSERFYPSVRKLLDKVKIISARGEYESKYPGDSRMWKIQSFLNMQKYFDNNLVTNIICLGDSFIEMEAGHVLASKFSRAFIKTIKFRESPKPEELNKQLSLVADQFPIIYSTIKNLTIRVEKKVKR